MSKSVVTIGYVTDIEGNYDYWLRFKRISRVMSIDFKGELKLRDNCHLVFGGDVCDRGKGDVRIAIELTKLKETFPDRVHIIVGNRDTNKMRLMVETDPRMMDVDLRPYWLRPDEFTSTNNQIDRLKNVHINATIVFLNCLLVCYIL